jgi:hypothetical protein
MELLLIGVFSMTTLSEIESASRFLARLLVCLNLRISILLGAL